MGEAYIIRRGGAGNKNTGTAGATLTVTAPEGSTVKLEKGEESYSTSTLPAVFTGLGSGTWTRTASLNGQTAVKEIPIVVEYTDEVTYFAAYIEVSYPAGSTLTCTQGDYSVTSSDTSGTHTFVVPYAGIWEISCTDGTEEAWAEAEITEDGQTLTVTLSYWNGELYSPGDMHEDITGGWVGRAWKAVADATSAAAPTLTNTDEYLLITSPASVCEGACQVNNDIDLTGVSGITITFKTSNFHHISSIHLVVISRDSTHWQTGDAEAIIQIHNGYDSDVSEWTSMTLDVSSVTGTWDIAICFRNTYYNSAYSPRYLYVESIVMEGA